MSKDVGEECGKREDGDPDGRTETRADITMPLCAQFEDGRIKIS